MLRDAVHRKAKVEAAAKFGLRFAGLPGIPEIGEVRRALDSIYTEDPAAVRARDRATLGALGLEPGEIGRWQNSLLLSPTRQALMMEAARSIGDVLGRAELFRHALGLGSDLEAQVYLQSVLLLIEAHRSRPVAAILPGVRLPAARLADGRIIVCGAFDAVYWTKDVADGQSQIEQALPPGAAAGRVLWLTGRASDRARAELQRRGWELHDEVVPPPSQPPPAR